MLSLEQTALSISPFYSWLDNRAESLSQAVRQVLGDFHTHCSFSVPLGLLALLKLLWLREHAPAMLAQTRKVAFLPSWFGQRLGGAIMIDRNLAAMSGLYSLPAAGWRTQALALCGLTPQQLPELVEMGETRVIPEVGNDSGLRNGIRIALCGNDQTCGAVGSGLQAGEVLVTLGTALVAYRLAGRQPGPYHPAGCWGPYPGGGFYEMGVAQGTAALDWACQLLLPGQEVADFVAFAGNALADRSFAPPEIFFYPDLMGTPQAWQGEGALSRRALAVLEGIGFSLSRLVSSLHTGGDMPTAVRVVGGGSRSDLWLQLLADILGIPVSRGRGDALLGAARQLLPDVNPPGGSDGQIFAPRPNWAGFYQERLVRWLSRDPYHTMKE